MPTLPANDLSRRGVERLARDLYGLAARATALPGELDLNFKLTTESGEAWVLKLMHPGRERSLLDLQCRALVHLADRRPDLALPRVRPTRSGELLARVRGAGEAEHWLWMLSFVPGRTLAAVRPHPPSLLAGIGGLLGAIDAALLDFSHPAARRELKWDLAQAGWIADFLGFLPDAHRRRWVEAVLATFEREVAPRLPVLRQSVIHGDANDHNVLVAVERGQPPRARALIDLGDMVLSRLVCEPAIAAAYALLGKAEPLAAAAALVAGYHRALPLTEEEIALLYPLIQVRLAISVTSSAYRKTLVPDDPYVTVSEAPAWEALERLQTLSPRLAHYTFRRACGLPAHPRTVAVTSYLERAAPAAAPVLGRELVVAGAQELDLSVGTPLLAADPAACELDALSRTLSEAMAAAGAEVGIGRWGEVRRTASGPLLGPAPSAEPRAVHLGLDLFCPPGTPVLAPLAGRVHALSRQPTQRGRGPWLLLAHEGPEGDHFFSLYAQLAPDLPAALEPGTAVAGGERIASVGAPPGNGGGAPHLHFQWVLDLLDDPAGFPTLARVSERAVWQDLCPDPRPLLRAPAAGQLPPDPDKAALLAARQAHLGRNVRLSYREPLAMVRGWMQYLVDDTGRAYLDAYNNVPHVGHSHPRVVEAVCRQTRLLNTNTRYLHPSRVEYVERLLARFPPELSVCYLLNSASEANELALRLVREATGREGMVVLAAAYHGHTSRLIDLSPYKFAGPGGHGRRPWVHVAPLPDDFRGPYKRSDPAAGERYAAEVAALIEQLVSEGRPPAAFLAESLPSVGGQIVLPSGYLAGVYTAVRAAGGLAIADEVQVGFGRLGTHFWGFESQGVVPDVVVLGKPIANGYPLAAVVTRPELAAAFDNGMELFSTFGGNPVACAAGLAVLAVLEEEKLQERALRVGGGLLADLRQLADRHPLIGDVRGSGLFLGVELVRDRGSLEPAAEEASYVVDRLREEGILTGTDGPLHNVLKVRPPLAFAEADADRLVATLDTILAESPLEP